VPTAYAQDLAPGETRPIEIRSPRLPQGQRRVVESVVLAGDQRDRPCVDVGSERCLRIDPWLYSAVVDLMRLDEGRALPEPIDALHFELNQIATIAQSDPSKFAETVAEHYVGECGRA
jgi:hypothetical protein